MAIAGSMLGLLIQGSTNHSGHDPYAVRLAVRYIKNTIAADEHAVRPRQRASKRIGLGAVTSATGAENCRDDPAVERDATNHMALSIGHVEPASPVGQPLWTRELG
jgi:hypothetical protein